MMSGHLALLASLISGVAALHAPPESLEWGDMFKPPAQVHNKQTGLWSAWGPPKAKKPAEQAIVEETVKEKVETPKTEAKHERDLVFMHIPSNFGHTIEKVGLMNKDANTQDMLNLISSKGSSFEKTAAPLAWTDVMKVARPDAEVWGRMSPQLQLVSNVTGCNLYYTPQQYWPKSIAKRYFRFMTVFGMLRDPYERLVAYFRANLNGYGGDYGKLHERCDVNTAVKKMMKRYIASDNKFMENCAFLPQAEYFQGQYGVTLPIDSRKFPQSLNAAFKGHGYDSVQVEDKDILSISGCPNVWAGDLDLEAKKLVRKVYAKDFELICKHFGHCNELENTCTEGAPGMCPKRVKAELQMMRFWTGKKA